TRLLIVPARANSDHLRQAGTYSGVFHRGDRRQGTASIRKRQDSKHTAGRDQSERPHKRSKMVECNPAEFLCRVSRRARTPSFGNTVVAAWVRQQAGPRARMATSTGAFSQHSTVVGFGPGFLQNLSRRCGWRRLDPRGEVATIDAEPPPSLRSS